MYLVNLCGNTAVLVHFLILVMEYHRCGNFIQERVSFLSLF